MSNPTKLLIPGDKANHALVGYVTYCLACIFLPTVSAVIPVIAIGAGKELRDMRAYKRPFDTKDFLYTVVGCIPALLVNLL